MSHVSSYPPTPQPSQIRSGVWYPTSLPMWNLVPIHVSIYQGSGVCFFIASYPTLCSHLCVPTFSDVVLFLRHCHTCQRDTPQVASIFLFTFTMYYLLNSHVPPIVCTSPGPGSPAMYMTGRGVCAVFCVIGFIPYFIAHVSFLFCLFCYFYSISFVLPPCMGFFRNSALARNLCHSSSPYHRICGSQFTSEKTYVAGSQGATLHIIYHHSIRIWELFKEAFTV